jgi:predicted hydrocarbon binding protein
LYEGFEIIPLANLPGRDITLLHVEFLKGAMEAVGVLRDLTAIIAMKEVPIINVYIVFPHAIIFLDTTGKSPKEVEEIAETLTKEVKFIKDVHIQMPEVKGFATDKTVTPTFFGEKAIVLRKSAFKSIIEGVFKSLKIAPQLVLYVVGKEMGEQYFERHVKIMGDVDKRSLAIIAERLFQAVGFGIPVNVKMDLEGGEIEYIIYDCLECGINLESGRRVKSSLIRGIIEGYYSKLLGREVECKEEECIALGDKICRMKIRAI